jgi:hypothetical protein
VPGTDNQTAAAEKGVTLKSLDTIMAALSWVMLAIVLWALAPLLIRLLDMADHINRLFSK